MTQNSSIKEKVLHPEQNAKAAPAPVNEEAKAAVGQDNCADELDERVCMALRAASEKKAQEMVVLDLREVASFTDYFLITSGTNVRQVQAIADAVVEQLKKQGTKAARVEGYNTAEWVLVDYGDFILHVFEDKARKFYDLERLWRDAKRVALPSDLAGAEGSLRTQS
ncbi:MAG TPA: ribosome silencing factor [Pyrinomonadaceae bacterium]|nr:ribosome silencing factor [Pyrinomonadaceae bacterium]